MTHEEKMEGVLQSIQTELKGIRAEQAGIREEQAAMREEQTAMREEQTAFRSELAAMRSDQKEMLVLIQSEREINNARFTQLSSTMITLQKDFQQTKQELKVEMHKMYSVLSEDIRVLVQDHLVLKKRVDRIDPYSTNRK